MREKISEIEIFFIDNLSTQKKDSPSEKMMEIKIEI